MVAKSMPAVLNCAYLATASADLSDSSLVSKVQCRSHDCVEHGENLRSGLISAFHLLHDRCLIIEIDTRERVVLRLQLSD